MSKIRAFFAAAEAEGEKIVKEIEVEAGKLEHAVAYWFGQGAEKVEVTAVDPPAADPAPAAADPSPAAITADTAGQPQAPAEPADKTTSGL